MIRDAEVIFLCGKIVLERGGNFVEGTKNVGDFILSDFSNFFGS